MVLMSSTFSGEMLFVAGVFTMGLGTWHLAVPRLFAFGAAILRSDQADAAVPPFRMGPLVYATRRVDLVGLAWVMSNAASYALVTIGLLDVVASAWLGRPEAPLIAAWIAGWWAVRAGSQLAIGRRTVDLATMSVFGLLAGLHLAVAAGWR